MVKPQGSTFRIIIFGCLSFSDFKLLFFSPFRLKKSCGLGRKCMALKGYTWILIYDVKLKYYPPVKFVPIKFPSGCACVV